VRWLWPGPRAGVEDGADIVGAASAGDVALTGVDGGDTGEWVGPPRSRASPPLLVDVSDDDGAVDAGMVDVVVVDAVVDDDVV
jgi:hypothetical protein